MVPPFVAVALNVTEAPVQIVVLEEVEIVTEGIIDVVIVIPKAFDVTGVVLAQAALELIVNVT